jgi:hypothetical protein
MRQNPASPARDRAVFDGAFLRVNRDDLSRGSDDLGDKQGDVARAAANVEHPHPWRNAAFPDQPPRQTF